MAKGSEEYWREREETQRQHNIHDEKQYNAEIQKIYQRMEDEIRKEINGFYGKYAAKEGITIEETRRRVSKLDMEEYSRKAKEYVANRDLSPQANEEMRLYNLTMKVNRLEMLKATIGVDMVGGFDDLEKLMGQKLTEKALDEMERQAGILGRTVQNNEEMAHAIVNASFHNAKFSDRIWMYQDMLKGELDQLLSTGLIQGKHPTELARHLHKFFGVSRYDAERLMRTEMARVQTEAQKQSLLANGFQEYEFITVGYAACPICAALDGKHFKLKEMQPGRNAPPMHPNCRCSIAAWMDEDVYNQWLDSGAAKEGVSFEEFTNRYSTALDDHLGIDKDYDIYAKGEYQSSKITENYNSPDIYNSDDVVDSFIRAIELPQNQEVIDRVKKSVRHMPEADLNMILSKGLIVRETSGACAFVHSRRSRGKDGELKYVIRINPHSKDPFVFAHECAHLAEKANRLYRDPEFTPVLKHFVDSITTIVPGKIGREYYSTAISDLLVEPYQGRTYVKDMGAFGPERDLKKEDFVEYISSGYECYIGEPKRLEQKDEELYNYFKRRGLR